MVRWPMNNIPSSQAVVPSWDKEGALGEGVPSATPDPMKAASSLEEVKRLVAAGAQLCSPDHRWLCTHAWLSEKKEDDRAWLTGWTELLAYGPREEQNALVFELGRCRQAPCNLCPQQ